MPTKKSAEEVLSTIKDAANKGRITMASSEGSKALEPEVLRVLVALGLPEARALKAFVSDRAYISDFKGVSDQPENQWLREASERLGVIVESKDFVVDVARRLRTKGEA